MKNECSHSIKRQEWKDDPDSDPYLAQGEWEYWTESTLVDIDTHRMKCSMCGKIEYYSHAAKQFYEKGVKNDLILYSLKKHE